jgi:hypothetical protein
VRREILEAHLDQIGILAAPAEAQLGLRPHNKHGCNATKLLRLWREKRGEIEPDCRFSDLRIYLDLTGTTTEEPDC